VRDHQRNITAFQDLHGPQVNRAAQSHHALQDLAHLIGTLHDLAGLRREDDARLVELHQPVEVAAVERLHKMLMHGLRCGT
jgi:hypothetical protein